MSQPGVDTSRLFPIKNFKSGFSTNAQLANILHGVTFVSIDDDHALGISKPSGLSHTVVHPPAPSALSSGAVQDQPVQEQPVQNQPVQEQPVQDQPVQVVQPVQTQPVQDQPVQVVQPVQDQPVQVVQPVQSQPVQDQPVQDVQPVQDPPSSESSPLSSSVSPLPAPTRAWQAFYPKGSINPGGPVPGGFGFYLSGPSAFSTHVQTATEVVFSYRFMLMHGWEWVQGGKLFGVYGGEGNLAFNCTGGRQNNRSQCFDLRIMWRGNGVSELYTYLPLTPNNNRRLLAVPPFSRPNTDFGYSVGRGAFTSNAAVGHWMSIAIRVKLNKVGSQDGEIQVWSNGKSVINIEGLELRMSEQGKIKGMHCQTFFGGHTSEWATPKDQKAWFADVCGAIIS